MSLDHDEGIPIRDDWPEWETVEQERDYWKQLAQDYGAKLKALELTMAAKWQIVHDESGRFWIQQTDEPRRAYPLDSLEHALSSPKPR